ncbi:IS110 family transposase [Kocuria rosea]|uniref:IS110 family transposase n=1 Tax=Kocuria rosea TaxID=1275 RepID=UPI000E08AFBB|nr:transposase [Kocuria rosea]STX04975.1 Transposase [Kocuria rosea]
MTTPITAVIDSSPELEVVAGVDTHADTHHVAVLSVTGARLGDLQVPATSRGYEQLLVFIRSFGTTRLVGIEGTSSYGAGLARYLIAQRVEIREIVRPRRAHRRHGKSDPIDAYAAAAQALADPEALPLAKTGEGVVEQIRVLLGVRRSAIKARVAVIRQIKSMLITAPVAIRTRWEGLNERCLVESLASTRPGPATGSVTTATGQGTVALTV